MGLFKLEFKATVQIHGCHYRISTLYCKIQRFVFMCAGRKMPLKLSVFPLCTNPGCFNFVHTLN